MDTKILDGKIKNKDELLRDFYDGIKAPSDFGLGLEIERVNVMKNSFEAVPYVLVEQFLAVFAAKYSWQKIKSNGHTIGLKKDGHYVSLEPGSQLELSLAPAANIFQMEEYLQDFNKKVAEISDMLGFCSLGYGIQPVSTFDGISIIPKDRYSMMTDYFVGKGEMAYVMMRETAGTQVSLDYSSEEDAMLKLRLGMCLAPIVSAMFSNSPVRGGKKTGYKSFRAKSWIYTDDDRCGFISPKLVDFDREFTFEDYAESLLDVPMIFVERDGKFFGVNKTFREFMTFGHEGLQATIEDWQLHSNLFFPEVRLRGFLEFRNADAQNLEMTLALVALYKGLFYDENSLTRLKNLLSGISYVDLCKMRFLAPMYALGVNVSGRRFSDLAQELVSIAFDGLPESEKQYLSTLSVLLNSGKTPADVLFEACGEDVPAIVEFCKI